jgi:hypothetical protein
MPYFCRPAKSTEGATGKFLIYFFQAEVAHLVEHDLAKVGVAGSSPVFRSMFLLPHRRRIFFEFEIRFLILVGITALVVELVDTQDLKSCLQQCG